MTSYLLLALLVLFGLVVILAQSLQTARQRTRIAEAKASAAEANYNAAMAELAARERDRHALEKDLAPLRSGSPQSRLGASLDVLRECASRAAGASPDSVAASQPPARDGN
ncbi:MAG: hypothetical protein JNG85_00245 [Spirochaetaceae bacterium]|nr:hypothetical protein [Spirochaetaceae bacterium]